MPERLSRRRLLGGAAGGVLGTAGLAACVQIPTSGPVEPGQGRPAQPNPSVSLAVNPPSPGASPLEIVTGFLQAMSYYQVDYAVAREYLTARARTGWHPEVGVQVYADGAAPDASEDSVRLAARIIGTVAADGSYTGEAKPREIEVDFGVVEENGEWRIARPPEGLLVSLYYFQQFFSAFNLYFFDPSYEVLVPDPVFLPAGNQSATALMRRLLAGATEWLRPAVATAIPPQAQFGVSVPVDENGIADVAWNDAVTGLDDEQRARLVAQVVWTLRQVPTVTTGVRFTANGTAWSVRALERSDGVVPITAQEAVSPIPRENSLALVGIGEQGVVRIDTENGGTSEFPIPWDRVEGLQSLALDAVGSTIAAVGGEGLELSVGEAGGEVTAVDDLPGVPLLRPQFTRFGELWTVDSPESGPSRVWRVVDGTATELEAPALAHDGPVTAFRISPDGMRIAVLQQGSEATRLSLALLNRANDDVVVTGLHRVVLLTTPALTSLVDVGWADASTLLVLGAVDPDGRPSPQLCRQDGTAVRAIGSPDQGSPSGLAVAPHLTRLRAAVLGQDGQAWRYEDDYSWVWVAKQITALAFPG